LPSYLTKGVAESIVRNVQAEKVFVANIVHDHDIPNRTVHDLLESLKYYLSRKDEYPLSSNQAIGRLFVQIPDQTRLNATRKSGSDYIPFNFDSVSLPPTSITAIDWEEEPGRHSGGRIVDELLYIAQQLVNVRLQPYRHKVSIIVPVLNERRTLPQVLSSLQQLDLGPLQLNKEIIVVDGGSDDGSLEYLQSTRFINLYRLPEGQRGRGAAIRFGMEKAQGNVIVTFPADNEYDSRDILNVVAPIVAGKSEFQLVFGNRPIKWQDLDATLRKIHGTDPVGRVISKYGGLLTSLACLIFYKRFISDPFTNLKAIDAGLLRRLNLQSRGVDLETEIVATALMAGQYILEVPVAYQPRPRSAGKKTTFGDGVQALYRLVRCLWHPHEWKQGRRFAYPLAIWSSVVTLFYFMQFRPYLSAALRIIGIK
jgi:glycosyltransferase involved in cell wall biosynthesis